MPYRTYSFILLLLALMLSSSAWAQRKPARVEFIDRIVAVVNNDVITLSELNERIHQVRRQLDSQKIPLPPQDVLEKQILERMINEKVQLQFASETGIRVDDTALDQAIGRIADGNRMTVDQLRQALEKDGVGFTKFRENIRNEIILSRLKEREADNRVVVTESELENYLANQTQKGNETEYNLAHILIQVPDQANAEKNRRASARRTAKGHQFRSSSSYFFRCARWAARRSAGLAASQPPAATLYRCPEQAPTWGNQPDPAQPELLSPAQAE
jgi:peptidyl-prolyl cis-trans isomerase SurA